MWRWHYWRRLETAVYHDPLTLRQDDVPEECGVYLWRCKTTKQIAYVGKATGAGGLRHRIFKRHLSPRCLEGRSIDKPIDAFQRQHAIIVKGRDGRPTPKIDQSTFRRSIGRLDHIAPGQPTVDYIRERFAVTWLIVALPKIKPLEDEFIVRLRPRYNPAVYRPAIRQHTAR